MRSHQVAGGSCAQERQEIVTNHTHHPTGIRTVLEYNLPTYEIRSLGKLFLICGFYYLTDAI